MSVPAHPTPELVDDSEQRALICPESGRLLLRYRVGHGLQFHLDRSPATGGVWLGRGEWEALKSKGLHTEMHLIFTAAYQRNIRSEQYGQRMEQTFRDRIGEPDFPRVVEIKKWVVANLLRMRQILPPFLEKAIFSVAAAASAQGRDRNAAHE